MVLGRIRPLSHMRRTSNPKSQRRAHQNQKRKVLIQNNSNKGSPCSPDPEFQTLANRHYCGALTPEAIQVTAPTLLWGSVCFLQCDHV